MKELEGLGCAGLDTGGGRAGLLRGGAVAKGVVGGGGGGGGEAFVRGEKTKSSRSTRLKAKGAELEKEQE